MQRLQGFLAKVITGKWKYDSVSEALSTLKWCRLETRLGRLATRRLIGWNYAPPTPYIDRVLHTVTDRRLSLRRPRHLREEFPHIERYKRAFSYWAPKRLNDMKDSTAGPLDAATLSLVAVGNQLPLDQTQCSDSTITLG